MTRRPNLDFLALLRALAESRVDFIIVGGVCGVLHGAPLATFDLDLVPAGDPENLDRLHSCLMIMNAFYRGREDERLIPERSHLEHSGHMLLMTDYGPLDILGTIGKGWDYEKLSWHIAIVPCEGLRLRVLDLETLIQVKQETAREKDKATISLLRSVLEERKRRGQWDRWSEVRHAEIGPIERVSLTLFDFS